MLRSAALHAASVPAFRPASRAASRAARRAASASASGSAGEGGGGGEESSPLPPPSAPAESLFDTLSRGGKNMVLGMGEADESEWRALDAKLNTYPYVREFKCIGSGGEEFVQSMLGAARSCCRPEEMPLLRREEVQVRPSKTGKYQAVSIFVTCDNFEQVKATYHAMKADVRLRYFI